jgi:hypothetical protein
MEFADALHGNRALQKSGPDPGPPAGPRPRHHVSRWPDLCRSWIEPNFDRWFQLMEYDGLRLLQPWLLTNNRDLGITFELVPVVPSKETREVVAPFLDDK